MTTAKAQKPSHSGFSLLELSFILLLLAGLLATLAVPTSKTALATYDLNAAVKDVAGAIEITRFLAIMKGYSYNIAFDQNTNSYQIGSRIPPATVFTNSSNPLPWSVTGDITLNPSTTLQFSPGGTVTATTGALSFTLSNGTTTQMITVSSIGELTVTQ